MTSLSPITTPRSTDRLLDGALFVALWLACGVGLTNNSTDPDLWGHVQYGRDVLRDGHLHNQATYTYTAVGNRWINHENLAELSFALGMDYLGPTGVLWLKFAVGMAIFGWYLHRALRSGVSLMTAGLVLLAASLAIMHFWLIRQQLLSYVCFSLMLPIFSYAFRGWEGEWHWGWPRFRATDSPSVVGTLRVPSELREDLDGARSVPATLNTLRLPALWLLVPLMLIWGNSHGAYIAGACVLTVYLGCRCVELYARFGLAATKAIAHIGAVMASSLAITLVNPYGWDLPIRLYHKLRVPRPEIIEWQPPELFSVVWIPFWALLGLWLIAVLGGRKRWDFTHLLIMAIVTWQACEHRRHIAFVAILSLAWLPTLLDEAWRTLRGMQNVTGTLRVPATWQDSPIARWGTLAAIAVGCCLALGMFFDQLRMLPVPRQRYPVDAFQFIADRGLDRQGKIVCQFEWAQYLIMACGQRQPGEAGLTLQFDGRFRTCYPQEVLDMYWDFDMGETPPGTRYRSPKSPPVDGSRVLSHLQPDLVLVGRHRPAALATMQEHAAEWTLLYQDELAQLWGRTTIYNDPLSPRYVAPAQRFISDLPRHGLVPWPALPQRTDIAPPAVSLAIPSSAHVAALTIGYES